MTGLETAYAALHTVLPELSAGKTVELLSSNVRKIFGLASATIAVGQPCLLSLFDPEGTTTISENTTRSKSKNTAFLNKALKGRVVGIINGEKLVMHGNEETK